MLGIEDWVRIKYHDVLQKEWYIEIWCLVHKVTNVGTGLFYKCDQEDLTKRIFESAKARGIRDNGDDFVLVLRRSDCIAEVHDKVNITKKHFEQITGLKALSGEEYYQKCENVPQYQDVGATNIDFLSLANS